MSPGLPETAQPKLSELACCIDCGTPLRGRDRCPGCERVYETRDDITQAIGPLRGRNGIVAAFYDGPGWVRFRKWERLFLTLQGGARRARMSILRCLPAPDRSEARVLEDFAWGSYTTNAARHRIAPRPACWRWASATERTLASFPDPGQSTG